MFAQINFDLIFDKILYLYTLNTKIRIRNFKFFSIDKVFYIRLLKVYVEYISN